MALICKKCGGEKHVKAGFIGGEQRFLCKNCGCKFVPTRQRGKPEKDKLLAIWLYMHGLSLRSIAKILSVTHKSVYDWVRALLETNYIRPEPQGDAVVVELDEVMCYLNSKRTEAGYGKLVIVIPINLSTGNAEGTTILHFQSLSND